MCWIESDFCDLMPAGSRYQFGNADQVVGDQIEQEVGATRVMREFGLAMVPCWLTPPEDALGHRRRDCDIRTPDAACSLVMATVAGLAVLVTAWFCVHRVTL